MNEKITELVFIIDRSGSMAGREDDTIGGFNSVLEKHREAEGEAFVTTVLFDHEQLTLHDRVAISDVKPITEDDYQVRGCTALLDAVGDTVKHVKRVQGYLPEDHKPGQTVVAIITDGLENASKRYGYREVKRLIDAQTELGWEFLFLGANIDAAAEAERIGIARKHAVTYLNDEIGAPLAYEAVAMASMQVRGHQTVMEDWKEAVEADTSSRR